MGVIAAVHLSAWTTALATALALLALAALWRRTGRAGVPVARRRVRRASLGIAALLLAVLVLGVAVVDPSVSPRGYAVVWTAALALVALLVASAVLDVLVTLGLRGEAQEGEGP